MKKFVSLILSLLLAVQIVSAQNPFTTLATRVAEASARPEKRDAMRQELRQAVAATDDPVYANFLVGQYRLVATGADIPVFVEYAASPALSATALNALAQIQGSDSALLEMVKTQAADPILLCAAISRKGLTAAEPYVLDWAKGSNGELRSAAAAALGRIGQRPETAEWLRFQEPLAYADFLANQLDRGQVKEAVKGAQALLSSPDSHVRTAAAAVLAHAYTPSKAAALAAAALEGDDRPYRNAVIDEVAGVIGAETLAPVLAKRWKKLSDTSREDLVQFLGNYRIASQLPLLKSAALWNEEAVADAACAAIGKIGGAEALSFLVEVLGGDHHEAASAALRSFPGSIADAVVSALGSNPSTSARVALLTLAGQKHITAVTPVVLADAASTDSDIRAAALKALPGVVGPDDVASLTAMLDKAAAEDVPALQKAFGASLQSLSKAEQFDRVHDILHDVRNAGRFYPALSQSGTDDAVNLLAQAAKGGDEDAFASLLTIRNGKAAPALYDLAVSSPEKAEKALCRYADLIRAFEPSVSKRYVSYARALKMDPPVSAKKKLLGGLTGVPTMKAFLLTEPYMDLDGDIGVAAAAAEAARQIASKTKEEIDYAAYVRILGKARTVFSAGKGADDGYAVDEINQLLNVPAPEIYKAELSSEEKAQGFEMLFDGSNLDKWQGDFEGYTPVNGEIYVSAGFGSTGNLYTRKEYRNFVYRFEFCFLREGVNNGVGVRTPMGVDAAYGAMCEVQILDHDAPMYAKLREYQVHGSVYGVIPAKRVVHKPLGEWSTEEIRVEGDHIKVTVNGEVIVDGDIRKACKGHNVAPDGSNDNPYTVDHKNHPGMFNRKGFISFCGHGEGLKLRNIRILDLGDKK